MGIELQLGDKIWMYYGPNVLIVGHVIDYSPDYSMVGISPLPYNSYSKMTNEQKASCPISWCETKACHYLCHIPCKQLEEHDIKVTPRVGFLTT